MFLIRIAKWGVPICIWIVIDDAGHMLIRDVDLETIDGLSVDQP
jgi:hypothetical protein